MKKDIYKKCCLCPSREGALKPTDTGGWAHVVCALYIQEVSFGDMAALEPIIVTNVPKERFKQTCSICTERQQNHLAGQGACMSCAKVGCKSAFHVTCAQEKGYLFEEFVNNNNNSVNGESTATETTSGGSNVAYRGYCAVHITKLRNSGRIRRNNLTVSQNKTSILSSTTTTGPVPPTSLTSLGGTEVHRPISNSSPVSSSAHGKQQLPNSSLNTNVLPYSNKPSVTSTTNTFNYPDSSDVDGRQNLAQNQYHQHPNPLLAGHGPAPVVSGIFSTSNRSKLSLNQQSPPGYPTSYSDRNSLYSTQRSPPLPGGVSGGSKLNLSSSDATFLTSMATASTVLPNGTEFVSNTSAKHSTKGGEKSQILNSPMSHHIANSLNVANSTFNRNTGAASPRCVQSTNNLIPPNGYLKSSQSAVSGTMHNGDVTGSLRNVSPSVVSGNGSPRVPKNGVSYVQTSNNNSIEYHNAIFTQQQANYNNSPTNNNMSQDSVRPKGAAKSAASLKRAEKMTVARKNNAQNNANDASSGTAGSGPGSIPPPHKKQRMKATPRRSTGSTGTGGTAMSTACAPDCVAATPEGSLPGGKRVKSSNSVSGGSPHMGPGSNSSLASPRLLGGSHNNVSSTSALSSPGMNAPHGGTFPSTTTESHFGSHLSPLLLDTDGAASRKHNRVGHSYLMSSDSDQLRRLSSSGAAGGGGGMATDPVMNYNYSPSAATSSTVTGSFGQPAPHRNVGCSASALTSSQQPMQRSNANNSSFIPPNSGHLSANAHSEGFKTEVTLNDSGAQVATSLGSAAGTVGAYSLTSMVSLLEEQWSQGSQFLMLQGKMYNIPSLLSSLYDLQTENRQLESELADIGAKRKQLHLMNQQLSVPLAASGSAGGVSSSVSGPAGGSGHPHSHMHSASGGPGSGSGPASLQITTNGLSAGVQHSSTNLDVNNSISSNTASAPVSGTSQVSLGSSHRAPSRSAKGSLNTGSNHPLSAGEANSFFPSSNSATGLSNQVSGMGAVYEQSGCERLNGGPSAGSLIHSSSGSLNSVATGGANRRTPNSTTTPLQSPISAHTSHHIAASHHQQHHPQQQQQHSNGAGGGSGGGGGQQNSASQLQTASSHPNQQQMSAVSPSADSQNSNNAALIINSSNAAAAATAAVLASRSTPNNSLSTSAVTAASIVQQQQQQQQQQIAAAQLAAAAAQVSYLDPSATYSLLAQQQLAAYHRALGISQQTSPQQPQPQTQSTTSPVVDQIAQSYRLAAAAAASGIDGTTQVLLNPAIMNTLFTAGPTAPR